MYKYKPVCFRMYDHLYLHVYLYADTTTYGCVNTYGLSIYEFCSDL